MSAASSYLELFKSTLYSIHAQSPKPLLLLGLRLHLYVESIGMYCHLGAQFPRWKSNCRIPLFPTTVSSMGVSLYRYVSGAEALQGCGVNEDKAPYLFSALSWLLSLFLGPKAQ